MNSSDRKAPRRDTDRKKERTVMDNLLDAYIENSGRRYAK